MKYSAFFVLSFLLCLSPFAQDEFSNFKGLRSEGQVPADFTTLSSEKFAADHAENTDKDLDKDFFLSTRFFMDQLLLSGAVLFNDPVTEYLNKVADYILAGNPELRKKLRFYILKTNEPNAFSTDQGIILFTTGLVAQLENEAQMAYILCHEISHYTAQHVRNEYVEQKKIIKGQGQYSRTSTRSRIGKMSQYSKELEFEADALGIDMYLDTEYSIEEIFSEFEVLLYSYLPFDDVKFDTTWLNTPAMVVPGSFYPDTIKEIAEVAGYDDDGHTHPNIEKRMDAAFDRLGDKKSKGDKKFVLPESDFYHVRNLCRFENVNISLSDREYGNALYSVFLLERMFPGNRFLDLSKVKALYGLAKYKNNSRYTEVTVKPTKVEGESYVLHALLKNLSQQQLNVIAFRHAYDMTVKYPGDPVFKAYSDDLKKEIALFSKLDISTLKAISYSEFLEKSTVNEQTFDIEDSITKIEASDLSKYEKIRLKKELKAQAEVLQGGTAVDKDFHLYALHDLVKGDVLKEMREIKTKHERVQDSLLTVKENSKSLIDKSLHLGIDKIVVVDPNYENYRLNDEQDHMKSEDKKLAIADYFLQDYDKLEMETQLVDSKNLASSGVDEYNDLAMLMQWVAEVVDHQDIAMISSSRDRMNDLTEKYGTSHFLFSGIYGYKERTEPTIAHLYGVIFVYTAPIAIADLLVVHNYFDLVAFSVNAENDDVEFVDVRTVNLKGIDRIIKAYVYDILYQLSSEPKAK